MKSPVLSNKTTDKVSPKHIGNKESISRSYTSCSGFASSVVLESSPLVHHQPTKNTFPMELLWERLHQQSQMISNLQKSVQGLLEARKDREVHISTPKKNMLSEFEENTILKPEVPVTNYLGSRWTTHPQLQECVWTISSNPQTTQLTSLFSSEYLTLRGEIDTLRNRMSQLEANHVTFESKQQKLIRNIIDLNKEVESLKCQQKQHLGYVDQENNGGTKPDMKMEITNLGRQLEKLAKGVEDLTERDKKIFSRDLHLPRYTQDSDKSQNSHEDPSLDVFSDLSLSSLESVPYSENKDKL
ncbi:uncharacterized protein LOC143257170 isoform X2 [Tachypleus tridentatus]